MIPAVEPAVARRGPVSLRGGQTHNTREGKRAPEAEHLRGRWCVVSAAIAVIRSFFVQQSARSVPIPRSKATSSSCVTGTGSRTRTHFAGGRVSVRATLGATPSATASIRRRGGAWRTRNVLRSVGRFRTTSASRVAPFAFARIRIADSTGRSCERRCRSARI